MSDDVSEAGQPQLHQGAWHTEDLAATIPDLLRRAVQSHSARPALIGADGESVTYGDLWDDARRIAGGLRERNVSSGDRVVLCLPNSTTWVRTYFGILLAGAVVVPVNVRLAEPEIDHIVHDCGAEVVIRSAEHVPFGDPYHDIGTTAESVAAICYTSGTTGRPKGATFRHRNVVAGVEVFFRALGADGATSEGVVTLVAVPLFHAAGLLTQLLTTVRQRGTVVVMTHFEVATFLRLLVEHRVQSLLGVPAILRALLDDSRFPGADTTSVRNVLYGAAPVPPDLVLDLLQAFPTARLGNGYGMTESGNVTYLPHRDAAGFPASVGFPSPGTEVRLDRVDDKGVGELLVRGPQVMTGYWNRPELDREVFQDGYLRTGDLCRFDEAGRIYVVDRIKDMIIRGGENVYSVEVESALSTVEGVLEVAVVGRPDPRMGECVAAVVVRAPGSDLNVVTILEHASRHLAPYKIPEYVLLRDGALPRNPGGKVLKRDLRELPDWADVPRARAPRAVDQPSR